jgi:hypothetical protein
VNLYASTNKINLHPELLKFVPSPLKDDPELFYRYEEYIFPKKPAITKIVKALFFCLLSLLTIVLQGILIFYLWHNANADISIKITYSLMLAICYAFSVPWSYICLLELPLLYRRWTRASEILKIKKEHNI